MTFDLDGIEIEPEDPEADVPTRRVSDLLADDTLGESAKRRVRSACEAQDIAPEEAVLVDTHAHLKQQELLAESAEVFSKLLRRRYGYTAAEVEGMDTRELARAVREAASE
jgi:hypothetical protein